MKKIISLLLTFLMMLSLCSVVQAEDELVLGKEFWSVSVNSKKTPIENAFDGKVNTFWHSDYTEKDGKVDTHDYPPFYVVIILPEVVTASGWRYTPRPEKGSGELTDYEFYVSETDSDIVTMVQKGKFEDDAKPKDLYFGGDLKIKKIVLKYVMGVNGYGTMAEFDLFKGKGNAITIESLAEPLVNKTYNLATGEEKGGAEEALNKRLGALKDKNKWEVTVSSFMGSSYNARSAFDGSDSTFWHSKYTAENGVVTWKEPSPYEFNIKFPDVVTISGLTYQPRKSGGGHIISMSVYGTAGDDEEFIRITDLKMNGDNTFKTNNFVANLKVKKLKLVITETEGGVGTAAEIDFLPMKDELPEKSLSEYMKYEEENKLYTLDRSKFSATDNCEVWAGHEPTMIFDGGTNSFWQAASDHKLPASLYVDMGSPQPVRAFSYQPRQTPDKHGIWIEFAVYAGNDPDNTELVYYEKSDAIEQKASLDTKYVELPETVIARYWEFEILTGNYKKAACAELNFFYTYQDKLAAEEAAREKYVLGIDSKTIKVEKGNESYEKQIDVAPFIYGNSGTTLIPLRGLLEEMGASVSWNGEEERITLSTETGGIRMRIQDPLVYVDNPLYGEVRYTMTVAPKIKEGRTFIPLRFVSEQLGYKVEWNGETREITISK